jgi:hypothetical protein
MGFGRGGGFGGGGRGWRHRFYATGAPGWMPYGQGGYTPPAADPQQEVTALRQQADYFANALEDIRKRIGELEAKPADK